MCVDSFRCTFIESYIELLLILILNVFNDYNNSKLVIMVKNKFVHFIIM
jgi:hypothetical protein